MTSHHDEATHRARCLHYLHEELLLDPGRDVPDALRTASADIAQVAATAVASAEPSTDGRELASAMEHLERAHFALRRAFATDSWKGATTPTERKESADYRYARDNALYDRAMNEGRASTPRPLRENYS